MLSTECGMRNSECGIERKGRSLAETSTDIPHSTFRIPHLLAGVMLLALATPPAAAQQPDSVPTDTLPPVVVTGVRLPAPPEMARGPPGQSATPSAAHLAARGWATPAAPPEMLPAAPSPAESG